MSATDPFGLAGQVLDGQFRVDKLVGEGGFSVVYRGHHQGLNEPIAIKCLKLPAALGTSLVDTFVQRFRDESRILYRLSQGNLHVVRSIAAGTTQAPATGALVPYMVLEWLEGRSLQNDFTVRRTNGQRGRSLADVMKLFETAADGLAHAHAQGVIHRDLNPGNFYLAKTASGETMKVLDFGVAKIMHDSSLDLGPRAQTIGAIRIFAPAYGAPEQFDDRIGAVGAWTDVYAFALVLIEALRDKSVVEGTHLGDFAQAAVDPKKRPTPRAFGVEVPDEVEAAFARATALDPKERWSSAGDFWKALSIAVKVASEHKHELAARETPKLALGATMAMPQAPRIPAKPGAPASPASPAAPASPATPATPAGRTPLAKTMPLGTSTPGFPRPGAPRPAGSRTPTTLGIPAPANIPARPPAPAGAAPAAPVQVPPPPAPVRPASTPPPAAGRPPSMPRMPAAPLASTMSPATERYSTLQAKPIDEATRPIDEATKPPPALPPLEDEEEEQTRVHAPTDEVLRTLATHDANMARSALTAVADMSAVPTPPPKPLEFDDTSGLAEAARAASPRPSSPPSPPSVPPPDRESGATLMMASPAAQQQQQQKLDARSATPVPPPLAPPAPHHAGLGSTVAMSPMSPGYGFPPGSHPSPAGGMPAQHATSGAPLPGGPMGAPPGATSNIHTQPTTQAFAPVPTPGFAIPSTASQAPPVNALPPASYAQPAVEVPKGKLPIVPIAIGAAVLAIVGVVLTVVALRGRSPSSTDGVTSASAGTATESAAATTAAPVPTPAPTETATAAPSASDTELDAPDAAAAAAPSAEGDASAAAASATAPAATAAPAATTAAPPQVATAAPAFTPPVATAAPVAPPPTAAPSAKPAGDPSGFNEASARSKLQQANGILAFCKKEGGVSGPGNASVTFGINGTVAGVAFDPPYSGTKEADCVANQFRRAKIDPFTGAPRTVRHAFEVPK